jgi:hypothetical protein
MGQAWGMVESVSKDIYRTPYRPGSRVECVNTDFPSSEKHRLPELLWQLRSARLKSLDTLSSCFEIDWTLRAASSTCSIVIIEDSPI